MANKTPEQVLRELLAQRAASASGASAAGTGTTDRRQAAFERAYEEYKRRLRSSVGAQPGFGGSAFGSFVLPRAVSYAQAGQQQTADIASSLGGRGMYSPDRGDLNAWSYDASRQGVIDRAAITKYLSGLGIFDTEEYATDSTTMHMASDDYIKKLLEDYQMKLASSRVQDDFVKAQQEQATTQSAWLQGEYQKLRNSQATEDPLQQMQDWTYFDWLSGDRATPYDFSAIMGRYNQMSDEDYYSEEDRLREQFEAADWDALINPETRYYDSKTGQYQALVDILTGEAERRKDITALEELARSNPEFAELSKYRGEQLTLGENEENMFSSPYFFANNAGVDEKTFNQATYKTRLNYATRDVENYESPFLERGYQFLTQDELAVYNALFHTDQQKAVEYLNALQPQLYQRRADVDESFWRTLASNEGTGALAWMLSFTMGALNANKSVEQVVQNLLGQGDPNSGAFKYLNSQQAIRNEQAERLAEIDPTGLKLLGKTPLELLYTGVNTTGDAAIGIGLDALLGGTGKINQAYMGMQAASGASQDSAARGIQGVEALVRAGGDAAIEALAEHLGFGPDGKGGASTKAFKAWLMDVAGEGLEEGVSNIGSTLMDVGTSAAFGHDNALQEEAKALEAQGDENPWGTVIKNHAQELGLDMLMGGFAGGGLGMGRAISTAVADRSTGKSIKTQGDAEAILDIAASMPAGSESRQVADEVKAKADKKGGIQSVAFGDLGRLTRALESELGTERSAVVDRVMDEAIEQRLVELGEDPATARKQAAMVRKVSRGQKPTAFETAAVKWSQNASQVVRELSRVTTTADAERTGRSWAVEASGKATEAAFGVMGKQAQLRRAVVERSSVAEAATKAAEKGASLTKGRKGTFSGKAVAFSDGTKEGSGEGEFQRFVRGKDGFAMVIKTDSGTREVQVDNLTGADSAGLAAIADYVQHEAKRTVSAEEANTMAQVYGKVGGDVNRFLRDFDEVYLSGYSGVAKPATRLEEAAAQIAYEQGKAEAEKDEQNRVTRAKALRASTDGSVVWLGTKEADDKVRTGEGDMPLSEALEGMTESQRTTAELVDAFAKEFRINVGLFASDEKNIGTIQNGSYDPSTHTVYIDVNADAASAEDIKRMKDQGTLGYAMMTVLGHELTHHLESTSADGYARYKQAVKDQLRNSGEDWTALVREKIDQAVQDGRKLTLAGAEAEVVADASEFMLQDSKFTKRLGEGVKGKVKAFVQGFMEKLNTAFRTLTGRRESAALRTMQDGVYRYTEKLQTLWDAAMEESLTGAVKDGAEDVAKADSEAPDGIILDEGGVGGYGDEVQDRGISVVVRKSNQVKSTTENVGPFDPETPDIRYSRRDTTEQTETANEAYEKYREASMLLNDIRKRQRELNDSDEMKAVYELMDKDAEAGAEAYKNLLELHDLNVNTREMQKQESELYRRWEELRDRELEAEEAAEIEKSGKTESEYRRDKAVKEFGYTPYFYDAGYIVPNGKMLNFSGEKNRHFGSRGQDHRAVSTVYANKTGSEAMVAFMHGGNIRIMPESPGLDIASSVEPTTQQYATIRKFVREYGDDEYLNIDFTNEKGNVVGNLEYEGRIYPDRVVNDIKHYFETGEIREQGISAFRYSRRTAPDAVTIREVLGSMEPTDRMTETEKLLLKRYKENLSALQKVEDSIRKEEETLKTATGQEIIKTKNRLKVLRDQAARATRALAAAERNDGFANLMATSQVMVNQYLNGMTGSLADAQDALETEIKGLSDQLKGLAEDVTEAASGQRAAFARGLFDQTQLNTAAKRLKDNYGSKMSVKSIADRLALAYAEMYAEDSAEGVKRFAEDARELAHEILDSSRYRYKSETLTALASSVGTISLTETDKQEIRNAGLTLTEYKRAISPVIRVAEGASDLSSHMSNAVYYGGEVAAILGDEAEGNLAMALYNVITREKAAEGDATFEGMTAEQSLSQVMADIAGATLPISTNDKTTEYLRKALLRYAGESTEAAQLIDEAIGRASAATRRAGAVWRAAAKDAMLARDALEYYRKLEEQRRLTELREQKEAITDQLKTDSAKKLAERVEEYREREQKARDYRHSRDDVMKLRRKISRTVKRLNALRMRETDAKHVPEELQPLVDTLMRTVTDGALARLAFSAERSASLGRAYREIGKLESDINRTWDDEMQEKLDLIAKMSKAYSELKLKDDGSMRGFYTLEGVQLEQQILAQVSDVVDNIALMVDDANKEFLQGRTETFNVFANEAGETLMQREDAKQLKGWAGDTQRIVDDWIVKGNMTPIYFIEHLENPKVQAVFDTIRTGQSDYARIIARGKRFEAETKAKYNYGSWVGDPALSYKTSQGHEITLTREQAMWVYATAKREQSNKLYNTEHLQVGGFVYKDTANVGEGKYRADKGPHSLSTADVKAISDWLTAEQKAYADAMVGFLSSDMAEYGNEASMRMFGYKKFTETYYFPFGVSAEQRYQKGDEGAAGAEAGTGRVMNSGFTKKLQYKANTALEMDNFSTVVSAHIQNMSVYAAMVEPIENMKRLMNHKVVKEDGTINTIRALIGQKYGEPSMKYMQDLLKDLNGAAQSDQRAMEGVNKLVAAFKRGAVMASASVVLQQPTAMARAMAMIDPKYFANNPFYRPGKGTWDEMMQYCGTAIIKDMGKFDVGMGLTAAQYIEDENLTPMEAMKRMKAAGKGAQAKAGYDRFMAWLTAAPGKADQWTWGLIWKAVKAEQAALNPRMDVNSQEFLDMCGKRFDDVIDHTQVYDSVLTRSSLMRSKSAVHQAATSFMSEATLSLNMLYDAITGKHGKKKGARIIASVAGAQIAAGLLAALPQGFNDDEDERNWLEKYSDRALQNVWSNLNPLGMIPYIRDIISMVDGYDVERPDMSVIKDLFDYTTKYFKAYEDGGRPTWKQTENFAGTWLNLLGVPWKNISREIRRTRNAVFSTDWSAPDGSNLGYVALEATGESLLPWYEATNKTYYARIAAAQADGKEQTAADLKEYMLTSKMVTEDALKAGVKKAYGDRYKAGGIEKADAIEFLLDNGLEENEKDAFTTVDKWDEGSDKHSVYNTVEEALKQNDVAAAKAAVKELTEYGWEQEAVTEQVRGKVKSLYKAGSLTQAQLKSMYKALDLYPTNFDPEDENDWYWHFQELDYYKKNGADAPEWTKYGSFYTAAETGTNLKAVIKTYTDHGVEAKTLAGCITSYFKKKYIELWEAGKKTEFANLQARILTAYQALGYDRNKKLKDIQKWLEDKD